MRAYKTIFFLVCVSMGASCSKKDGITAVSISTDSTLFTVESALSSLNGALNDAEQLDDFTLRAPRKNDFFSFISKAYAAACSQSRFFPPVGFPTCAGTTNNRTVTSNLGNCTAGPSNEYILRGTVSLAFDAAATCDTWITGAMLPTSGNVVRTTSNFLRLNPNGTSVRTSSDPHQNYLGSTVSGGARTAFGMGTRTLDILGFQRTGIGANGSTVFDHSVYSTQAIVVTGTKAGGDRQVTAGAIRVDHNVAKYSALATVTGLEWSANCCYPTNGAITWALSGSISGNIAVDFNTGTCGSAEVSSSINGSGGTVTLQSCE